MTTPQPRPESDVRRTLHQVKRRGWRDPVVALWAGTLMIALVLGALWLYMVYRVRLEVQLLRIQYEAHLKDRAIQDAAWRAEFDTIYRTLYSPPDTPAEQKRQPSAVELWQVNRDRELRARIQKLEQWRFQQER